MGKGRGAPSRRRRSRRKKLGPGAVQKAFWVIIAASLIYGVYRMGRDPICAAFVRMERASPKTVSFTLSADALIIPSEEIVTAPSPGIVDFLLEDGARVRTGTQVAKITTFPGADALLGKGDVLVVAPSPGILSFHFDGWEGALSRERLKAVAGQVFFESGAQEALRRNGDRVRKGESLFKIVDPGGFQVAALVPAKFREEIESSGQNRSGSWRSLRINPLSETDVAAVVTDMFFRPGDDSLVVMFDIRMSPERLLDSRRIDMEIVRGVYSGVRVPLRSMVERNGEKGVYIASATTASFRPVEVKVLDKDSAIVEGIRPGDEVILNPWLVREGMILR